MTAFALDRQPLDEAPRPYRPIYRPNEINRCDGCGGSHWIIGRHIAECGNKRCGNALPLAHPDTVSGGTNG